MLSRPRFRPHIHVEVLPGEGVVLLSDTRHSLLRGRLNELVVPWLDGRTANDVCAHLRAEASPAEVYYALKHVGVLYQTMYLTATAMGLAPCAVGGGNADLFAKATGLDPYSEASVGEFLLGN